MKTIIKWKINYRHAAYWCNYRIFKAWSLPYHPKRCCKNYSLPSKHQWRALRFSMKMEFTIT